jgi:hypothetical protein
MSNELAALYMDLKSFILPSGSKQIIRAIHKHFATNSSDKKHQDPPQSKLFGAKIYNLATRFMKDNIPALDLETLKDVEVIEEDHLWMIVCPFCDGKFTVQMKKNSCKISNFERHVKDKHVQYLNEDPVDPTEEESSASNSSPPIYPSPKKIAITNPSTSQTPTAFPTSSNNESAKHQNIDASRRKQTTPQRNVRAALRVSLRKH